ncbi:general transcription factor IIF subunit 1 [Planococcus citri]|uniref:general transcription factor IIF subunit 1 n=1 Tax=Planococcus citri TaxID=170843 RepID=UPI0031FA1939
MNVSSSQSSDSTSTASSTQEFSIRVPKNQKKKFNIMRFNSNLNVDFSEWKQVKMERENNRGEKHASEEMPKYGAGSEFRREEKEEARKKKFGYTSRTYNPDDQPWILKCGGKTGKKFRGIREGGVGENAAYYVFTQGNDGSIEAYPVSEWYNFQPVQRFKALSAEEAEQEFGKRNRSLNYFSLMMRKKCRKDEDDEIDEEGSSKKNKGRGRDFKISDIDDWVESDDDDDNDSEDDDPENKESKKKKKETAKKKATQKKKKTNTDESAGEESDDGDEEGRELDYISDSSESISDHEAKIDKEMKGVSDESALRKLLTSDEEEEEEEEAKKSGDEGNKSEQEEPAAAEETPQPASSSKKKRKREPAPTKPSTSDPPIKNEDTSSDFSADSSDSEGEKTKKADVSIDGASVSLNDSLDGPESLTKKPRLETPGEVGISEEAVRRYLTRKPMTAKELLQKFKKPKTTLTSEQLVIVMTQILKKINPVKQTIKNKMYLSLKPENPKPKP